MRAWANYDDALAQLRGAGLEIDAIEVDTPRPVRCLEVGGDREKRCWYWLSEIELTNSDGQRAWYITGAYGIYRGAENIKHKVDLRLTKRRIALSSEQKAAIEERHRDAIRRRRAIRDAEIKKAAARAQHAWSKYVPDGTSDYLKSKRVGGHGIRFSPSGNGTVAIPMLDTAGRIWGLQVIRSGAGRRGRLQKEYWPKGLDKIGHFHQLGAPSAGGVCLIAEGYATGATAFEAAQLPTAIAFDAGNLLHVAKALRAAYPGIRLVLLADDDFVQKCKECGEHTEVAAPECRGCGKPHGQKNPGIEAAKAAAFAVSGAWVAPSWPFQRNDRKITDFNDLATHAEGGPHLVRAQIWEALRVAGWSAPRVGVPAAVAEGGGAGEGRQAARSILPLDDAVERFLPIDDGTGKTLFDTWTQKLVLREQMVTLLPAGVRWDDVKRHPSWITRGSFYLDQVGFDPAGEDPNIRLNTWTGWPTKPAKGKCALALDLLRYMCADERNAGDVFDWIVKWLAYPVQHPGAKMRSALVVHGPQGTGKSRFFEAVVSIYGEYGILLNQGAIEDKFNSDWSSRKLFVLADEIVARQEMHHIKNQLKGFITGDWIRVNPKNLPAYRERNHINLVFLSNEKQPVVLENDDRRHCVIWTPQALGEDFYDELADELDNGGIAALHRHLLDVDLTGFHPWTKPPMTKAKADLIELGRSSIERFLAEWQALEIEASEGRILPFCPCLGSHLYAAYRRWCERVGDRDLGAKRLIGDIKKLPGWTAAQPEPTWRDFHERETFNRKMVVPDRGDMAASVARCITGLQAQLQFDKFASKKDWLTKCYFEFATAAGLIQ